MAAELAVSAAAAAYFPVVFFDGDSEIDVGSVLVHPSVGFKKFQASVSQRIGVAPHQISISLVRRKKARVSPEVRRKVTIDEASDFAAIARERDCFVLAVLRRPRRDRRGRSKRKSHEVGEEKKAVPEMTILRRNPMGSGVLDPMRGGLVPEAIAGPGLWDYEAQLRNLQRQRERHLISTAAAAAAAAAEVSYHPFAVGHRPASPASCRECEAAKAEGRSPGFHWCVHDAVTVAFRSPVGPIQRPPRSHVEASA
ncbi:hypothetical protein MUK42_19248 [Musa troglodytarum]|uniref:DUF7138 domain-containing protein n=1 Tax=Musa troglodytarum TaxID=320322 RepID=A0A9E7G010_9LILI|nr:hypothetical protein MUK42_19248 [Musa troglodytarum]